jgi:hypothetical protein
MNIGDKVKIIDGSYSVKLDPSTRSMTDIGDRKEDFTVVGTGPADHDIIIQSDATGEVYLHPSSFVRKVKFCPCCGKEI